MKRLLLLGLALLAVYMGGRAARRNAEVLNLLWVLIGLTATASTAGTAKSRSTEDRLSALIPKVFPNTGGTISGPVTVNGSHTVNGSMSVSGSHTVGGQVNANTLSVAGAGTTNGFTSHGGIVADGSIAAGGNVSGNQGVFGSLLSVSGQRIAPGQGTPPGYPVVGSPSTAGLGNLVNEIIGGLQAAGIFV